ncbi:uncharacterized protein LOC114523779 [Dendronephthya gigantea]|uniref:uncharacterized protein LOC114523779 n=1 Tax=Dendronephthya gigantea TaxID=151771 RepID=UPI00106D4672|nr:uncharacterized protein LOC114523779 [Dendronephthya gigantea]
MNNSSSNNRDLLTRTSNLLRTALCQLETGNVSETSSSFSEQGPSASTFSASPSGQSLQQGVQRRSASSVSGQGRSASDDFRRAFPGMCSRNVTRPLPSGNLQPPVKKTKGSIKGYVPLRFQPAETWTHDICILGRCNESLTPDRHRLDSLMAAGLGKMKVVFPNKNASHEELQKFMEEKFPKMKGSGGFEVLRAVGGGGGQRVLSLIPPSREGYSVSYLKERLGQAVAYFRPLQIDLDETEVKYDDVGPVINCIKCSTSFTYGEFKNHQLVCNPDGHKNMDL